MRIVRKENIDLCTQGHREELNGNSRLVDDAVVRDVRTPGVEAAIGFLYNASVNPTNVTNAKKRGLIVGTYMVYALARQPTDQ